MYGTFPPGKFLATRLAGLVVKHMLIAHTRAYHLIKSLPGTPPPPFSSPKPLEGGCGARQGVPPRTPSTCKSLPSTCLPPSLPQDQNDVTHRWPADPPAGGAESEVGLVHNYMRYETLKGDLLTRFAPHTHFIVQVRSLGMQHAQHEGR